MAISKSKEFEKRERNRRFRRFNENTILTVGWAVSLIIAAVIMFGAYDGETGGFSTGGMVFGVLYIISGVLGFLINMKMRSDIIKTGEISDAVRKAGFLLLPFVFTGNFFIAIGGFYTVKKEKNIEYLLAFYSFINTVMIIMVSLLNLFKEGLPKNFVLGMVLLAVMAVFYILVTILTCRWTVENGKYGHLMVPAVICMLTVLTGNLFALVYGLVVFSKIRSTKKNRTVEWIDIVRRVFRNYMSVIGFFIVVFLLSLSICSMLTFDKNISEENNYSVLKQHPTIMYPFGTDEFGRCIFTRIVFGARISLIIGFIATIAPLIIGGLLGAIAGHFSSALDNIIMRVLDILYAVPSILLAIAVVAAFGTSTFTLIIALSVGAIPTYARTMRAQVMVVTSNEFVEAARACGQNEFIILLKHIVPNALAPMIVRATLTIGSAVLSTSSLSFLGLGVEPHVPEWGNILKMGSTYLETHTYMALYPGLAIILIVLAFNFFGDGLRDALDPKLK